VEAWGDFAKKNEKNNLAIPGFWHFLPIYKRGNAT
jgi:hypothetical protein